MKINILLFEGFEVLDGREATSNKRALDWVARRIEYVWNDDRERDDFARNE